MSGAKQSGKAAGGRLEEPLTPEVQVQQIVNMVESVRRSAGKSKAQKQQKQQQFDGLIEIINQKLLEIEEMEIRDGSKGMLIKRLTDVRDSISEKFEVNPPQAPPSAIINKLIESAIQNIMRYENSTTAAFNRLSQPDKDRLLLFINQHGLDLLRDNIDEQTRSIPEGPRGEIVRIKLYTYTLNYIELCCKYLPMLFGMFGDQLYIPNIANEDEKRLIEAAFKAVIIYMLSIKSLSDSIALIIRNKFQTIASFLLAVPIVVFAGEVAVTAAPSLTTAIAFLKSNPFSLSDIAAIFNFIFEYRAQIGLGATMAYMNSDTLFELTDNVLSSTILQGYGMPIQDPIRRTVNRMNTDFLTRTRNNIYGGELMLPTNLLSIPYCIFHFIRSICVGQARAAIESARAVTHAIKSAPQKCGNMVNQANEAFSRWATTEDGRRVEITDLAAFDSFYVSVMSELAKNKSTYQDFGKNPHVLRCEANIARFHPDETLITAVRVDFQNASQILELYRRGDTDQLLRLSRGHLSELVAADDGNSVHEISSQLAVAPSSPSPEGGRSRQLDVDLTTLPNEAEVQQQYVEGPAGDIIGTVHPFVNPHFVAPSYGNSAAVRELDSFTNGPNKRIKGDSANGGATRNKRATKKYKSKTYKSKKNKRQSRRKVRRASSRKSRK
jgi:hypothetical protein